VVAVGLGKIIVDVAAGLEGTAAGATVKAGLHPTSIRKINSQTAIISTKFTCRSFASTELYRNYSAEKYR
jgi:hypothetical protein